MIHFATVLSLFILLDDIHVSHTVYSRIGNWFQQFCSLLRYFVLNKRIQDSTYLILSLVMCSNETKDTSNISGMPFCDVGILLYSGNLMAWQIDEKFCCMTYPKVLHTYCTAAHEAVSEHFLIRFKLCRWLP